MNHVTISGNLTADPEKIDTKSQTTVVKGRLAVNYGKERDAEFFNFTAFKKTAELILDNCKRGRPICIEGRLQQSSWETEEGEKRSRVEIIANSVFFGPEPRSKSTPASSEESATEDQAADGEEVAITF